MLVFVSVQALLAAGAFLVASNFSAITDYFQGAVSAANESTAVSEQVSAADKPAASNSSELVKVPESVKTASAAKPLAEEEPAASPVAALPQPVAPDTAETVQAAAEPEPEPAPAAAPEETEVAIEPEVESAAPAETEAAAQKPASGYVDPNTQISFVGSNAKPAEPVEAAVPQPAAAELEEPQAEAIPEAAPPDSATQQAALNALRPASDPLSKPDPKSLPRLSGEVFRDCDDCPELVIIIPAGEPALVGDGGTADVEQASTGSDTRGFALGRYEVTFAEWDKCVRDGACKSSPKDEGWGRDTRPVINVSYAEIEEQFLPWISRKTGATYRLPTAEEWETAAGNTAVATEGLAICQFGNTSASGAEGDQGPACDDGYTYTSPVGALSPNAMGIYDMQGNVWEWVTDCWNSGFTTKSRRGPEPECTARLLRGGAWSSAAASVRAGGRGWENPAKSKNSIGFRLARQLP